MTGHMAEPVVAIIIPARHDSTRYPGKPLAMLRGATGVAKSLLQRSYEAALRVSGVQSIHVATDSDLVREAAEGFGASVIMTSDCCENGTVRCADALARTPALRPDIVINLQGDAPLTPAWFIEDIIRRFVERPQVQVATPAVRCSPLFYDKLVEDERLGRVGGTSVVTDAADRALYFSKRLIPHQGRVAGSEEAPYSFLHIGAYGYRPRALDAYRAAAPSVLEQLEGLEQLRFLHHGIPVDVVEVASPDWEMWELNNPSDVPHIENALRIMGVE